MSQIEIAKRGENILSQSFRRADGRIKVFVKVHPSVEELLKSWGSGVSSSLYDFGGRNWIFSGTVPEVWDLNDHFIQPLQYDGGYFTLGRPGYGLYEEDTRLPGAKGVVNISFLRLVGISGGIEFELAGQPHSISYLRDVQEKIKLAVKRVYTDYLLPLDLTIQMNTQETRL